MRMTGHRTEAIYRRYAIVSTNDLRDAGIKLASLGDNSSGGGLQRPERRDGSA